MSFWILRENPVLDLTLSVPDEVEVGSTISMVITATNPHDIPVTLDSVDIDDSFLSGFQVRSINPEAAKTHHLPFLKQRRWDFSKPVLPGESFTVSFTLKPVAEGHFFGDVDIANPSQDFTTVFADVVAQKSISNGLPQ